VKSTPLTFSDLWEFFPCNVNNRQYSIRFDTAVESLNEEIKASYPHTLELLVHFNEMNEQGLPTPIERARINNIEDNLTCGTYDVRLVGVITGDGCVRFAFCYGDEAEAEHIAQSLLGEHKHTVKYECKAFLDNNFGYYYNTLAPNNYERNGIMNRHVCTNLEKDGELFQTPRKIDFFCYFVTEQHIESVAEELKQQGFSEFARDKTEQGDYLLHLTREGIPELAWINEVTADILDVLEGTDGSFDGWGSPIHRS